VTSIHIHELIVKRRGNPVAVECHGQNSQLQRRRWSRALEIPLYQLFCKGNGTPPPTKTIRKAPAWGKSGKEARLLKTLCTLFSRTDENDRQLLLHMARKMVDH
jgi:hypothetical protein